MAGEEAVPKRCETQVEDAQDEANMGGPNLGRPMAHVLRHFPLGELRGKAGRKRNDRTVRRFQGHRRHLNLRLTGLGASCRGVGAQGLGFETEEVDEIDDRLIDYIRYCQCPRMHDVVCTRMFIHISRVRVIIAIVMPQFMIGRFLF